MAENKTQDHKLVLTNQEQMELTGIIRVESFNPEEIVLETDCGVLAIKGEELDINNLNLENRLVEIAGHITEIIYTGQDSVGQGRKGWLERIFK